MWPDEVRDSMSVSWGWGDVKNESEMFWKDSIVKDEWTLLQGSLSDICMRQVDAIVQSGLFFLRAKTDPQ